MSKMGFYIIKERRSALPVAPKSKYTKEEFIAECLKHMKKEISSEEVQEGYCRYNPPRGGCTEGSYTFADAGRGAFPVWYVTDKY